MEKLLLKAVATVTDQGVFEAVVSTATIDREKDIVDPQGFARSLAKWVPLGKKLPLSWNHSLAAEDIIGHIEPSSVKAQGSEVVVSGWIDQNTPRGKEAWRLVKSGTLGFSFGYLIPDGGSTKRAGGGRHIKDLDVYEVTATPAPMNNDTRVLSFKAMMDSEADDATETPLQAVRDAVEELQEFIDGERSESDAADVARAQRLVAGLQQLMQAEMGEPDGGKALFFADEFAAAVAGDLKAVWTTAYINDLPDSAFLYVEPGGNKSDRHFPYKDAGGNVDLPHLRNALSRIPQSNLPQDVKDRLTAKAQRILNDAQKSVDGTGKEFSARPVDPLRERFNALALEIAGDGVDRSKPPQVKAAPEPSALSPSEVRERYRTAMLTILSGDIE